MGFWVCILYSEKLNRFYIGATLDIEERMNFHHSSPAHKFTGKSDDWELFLKSECDNKKQALLVERHIKRMKSRKYIENLKNHPEILEKLKARYTDC